MAKTPYDTDLDRNPANFQPLTPLGFLERAAAVFPDHTAIIHGPLRRTYAEFYARARRLASALAKRGIKRGDTRLGDARQYAGHAGMPLRRADDARRAQHAQHAARCADHRLLARPCRGQGGDHRPRIFQGDEGGAGALQGQAAGDRLRRSGIFRRRASGWAIEYEEFFASGDPDYVWAMPDDEWDAITLNYTSGTTGDPKGVVYHHRGAHLLAMGNVITCGMRQHPVYLWTLPMFHCNGWCFPWTISIVAGTHVCLRAVRAGAMYDAIATHKVTHLCGAPIVMAVLLNATEAEKKPLPHVVNFATAAAPPPEAVLAAMKAAGFNVTHVYGLTECYGPSVVNEWHDAWDALSGSEQAAKKARQGVRYPRAGSARRARSDTLAPVARDGETLGEVMMRGNVVMKGYLKNKASTEKAFEGGWFHTGDLGVMLSGRLYPAQGPLQGHHHFRRREYFIDRGGRRSLQASGGRRRRGGGQARRQMGRDAVRLRGIQAGAKASADELLQWCRQHLAGYKCPRYVVFAEIPKTSTGKI